MSLNKTQMLNRLIEHYANGNKSRFAAILGVKPQNVVAWLSRDTFNAELIFAKCEGVSAEWLLTGEGEMIKGAPRNGSRETINFLQQQVKDRDRLLDEKERLIQVLLNGRLSVDSDIK